MPAKAKWMALLISRVEPISPSQIAAAYWKTDASVRAIAAHYRCTVPQVRKLAGRATMTGMPPCPVCLKLFTAEGRDEAMHLLELPVYPEDSFQGQVPVCCGRWIGWYDPLDPGDHSSGEFGGGEIGACWRNLNGR